MENFKNKCDVAYDIGNPIITDSDYDSLFGCNASALLNKEHNVTLPFWMGSLNKIKTEKALSLWLLKNLADTFVVSCKLDGISALYHNNKLYTRGNGLKGTDISRFLNNLNTTFGSPEGIKGNFVRALRGELVMKKNVFEAKYKKFKNSRNLVAGQFAKKEIDSSIIKDIDFVPYEIISLVEKDKKELLPSAQFQIFDTAFSQPFQIIDRKDLTIDFLNNLFNKFVILSDYTIDGLVISANELYTRNIDGNPKYSFAFKKKTETTSAIATVTKIQWTLSKWGVYIPVVHINPVELSGCTISKLTGHNAKYIVENKIEEGSKLVCVRSGDVIPHIVEVIKPSEKIIQLPIGCWAGVHIKQLSDDVNPDVEIKILTSLLIKLGVKNINIKTVEKLYNNFNNNQKQKLENAKAQRFAYLKGIDVFFKIISCSDNSSLLSIDLFKNKTRSNIISEIVNLRSRPIQLHTLISASSLLGYGLSDKRIDMLLTKLPNFLNSEPTMAELCGVDGFSSKIAQKIIDNYFPTIHFIQTCQDKLNIINLPVNLPENKQKNKQETPTIKKKICLSGFRDKTLSNKYLVLNSVTKYCELLVVSDVDQDDTIKVKQARKLNIPIVSREQLTKSE